LKSWRGTRSGHVQTWPLDQGEEAGHRDRLKVARCCAIEGDAYPRHPLGRTGASRGRTLPRPHPQPFPTGKGAFSEIRRTAYIRHRAHPAAPGFSTAWTRHPAATHRADAGFAREESRAARRGPSRTALAAGQPSGNVSPERAPVNTFSVGREHGEPQEQSVKPALQVATPPALDRPKDHGTQGGGRHRINLGAVDI